MNTTYLCSMKWIEKLKDRWGIESNKQFWIIMLVFSITGMSAVQIRKLIFPLVGIGASTPMWLYILLWLLMITPFYYIFLTIYAWIFGQSKFFNAMTKKTFSRFTGKKKNDEYQK